MAGQDACQALVTSAAIMLVAALIIWLLLLLVAVAFCRAAAGADRRQAAEVSYPLRSDGMEVGGGIARDRGSAGPGDGLRGDGQGARGEPRMRGGGRQPAGSWSTGVPRG